MKNIETIDDLIDEHNRLLKGKIPKVPEENRQMDIRFIDAVKKSHGNLTADEFIKKYI